MIARNKQAEKEEAEPKVRRRRLRAHEENFRVGRTLAGEAFNDERKVKLERVKQRRHERIKNIATVVGILLIVVLLALVVGHYVADVIRERKEEQVEEVPREPSVTIVDENAGENVSQRAKEFVVRLEDDVRDYGYEVDHVVLPLQKAREIHVYIKDRKEFYKMTIDRGSALQAEDMARMAKYLDEKGLKPGYVDVRVEGKAFYK